MAVQQADSAVSTLKAMLLEELCHHKKLTTEVKNRLTRELLRSVNRTRELLSARQPLHQP